VATGANWRRNGLGRWHSAPVAGVDQGAVFTPDDIMAGRLPRGRVVIFDDDHYYMAPVIAEALVSSGASVGYVTTEATVCTWGVHTREQHRSQRRLIELGVDLTFGAAVDGFAGGSVTTSCIYTGRTGVLAADALVLVTSREPDTALFSDLVARGMTGASLRAIGDCWQPSIIAAAVYAGHQAGREIGLPAPPPVRRDRVVVDRSS